MTRTEIQQRIYDIDAAIEYKIREITELLNERRQLQAQLANAETLDTEAVIEMAEDDIRRLSKHSAKLYYGIAEDGTVFARRRIKHYPDIFCWITVEAETPEDVPHEIPLAAVMRIAAGLPIPKEYKPFLQQIDQYEE